MTYLLNYLIGNYIYGLIYCNAGSRFFTQMTTFVRSGVTVVAISNILVLVEVSTNRSVVKDHSATSEGLYSRRPSQNFAGAMKMPPAEVNEMNLTRFVRDLCFICGPKAHHEDLLQMIIPVAFVPFGEHFGVSSMEVFPSEVVHFMFFWLTDSQPDKKTGWSLGVPKDKKTEIPKETPPSPFPTNFGFRRTQQMMNSAGDYDVKLTSPGDWLCEASSLAVMVSASGMRVSNHRWSPSRTKIEQNSMVSKWYIWWGETWLGIWSGW